MQNISSKTPVLYRPHRGTLADAMREVVEVNDLPQLVRHMRRSVEHWYPKDELPTLENTKLEPYGFDDRISWDTYIVTVKGTAWGFTSGPLPEAASELKQLRSENARLRMGAAHTAGFLEGMADRIEGWVRWSNGEVDTGSFTKAMQDCRAMADSIQHYVLG